MARVFTIAPGLENMGGLKTGGQGSIYKGRRIGDILTAVKLLHTPVQGDGSADRNYQAFQQEVAKLRKLNERPNPNVVKIVGSGISETGKLPYVEMEFVEGLDLDDLQSHENNCIFTLHQTLKVAEQIACALAGCHRLEIRHGDVKNGNVRFNSNTGNYVLLGFGMAMTGIEQRRSILRQAASVEFMAPEQHNGQILFQSDVYGFGIMLFKLLTGVVPFQLKDTTESARNEVRLAHMASPVPDLLQLRRYAVPSDWDDDRKRFEMQVPEWIISLVNKCLEKKAEKRFKSGAELYNFICDHIGVHVKNAKLSNPAIFNQPHETPAAMHEQLKKQLIHYRHELLKKQCEVNDLKAQLVSNEKNSTVFPISSNATGRRAHNRVSTTAFVALLLIAMGLSAFVVYPVVKNRSTVPEKPGHVTNRVVHRSGIKPTDASTVIEEESQNKRSALPVKTMQNNQNQVAEAAEDDSVMDKDNEEWPSDRVQRKTTDARTDTSSNSAEKSIDSGKHSDEDKNTDRQTGTQSEKNDWNIKSERSGVSMNYNPGFGGGLLAHTILSGDASSAFRYFNGTVGPVSAEGTVLYM